MADPRPPSNKDQRAPSQQLSPPLPVVVGPYVPMSQFSPATGQVMMAAQYSPLDLLGATAENLSNHSVGKQNTVGATLSGRSAQLRQSPLPSLLKHDPIRTRIQRLIEQELRIRHPFREEWQRKCTEMAAQLEEVLFRSAKSFGEYFDESTLPLRLVEIFMAKKKREMSKDRDDGEAIYNTVLEKASNRWLTGEEIVVLLMRCSRKMPCHLMMNDSAFVPTSGSLFHFGSAVARDGYNWLKTTGTNIAQEHQFILTVGGQPRVCVSLNVDIQNKMYRRTYWLPENASMGVLVHYLAETPSSAPHNSTCFCLACMFRKESSDESQHGSGQVSEQKHNKRARSD